MKLTIYLNKRFLILLIGILLIIGIYFGYKEYKRRIASECSGFLLREENKNLILPNNHKCYETQKFLKEFIVDY